MMLPSTFLDLRARCHRYLLKRASFTVDTEIRHLLLTDKQARKHCRSSALRKQRIESIAFI